MLGLADTRTVPVFAVILREDFSFYFGQVTPLLILSLVDWLSGVTFFRVGDIKACFLGGPLFLLKLIKKQIEFDR